jgi:chlorite dismutase
MPGGVSMHTQLQEIEQIVERALEKMEQLRKERQELVGQIENYEKIIQDKDLELIRLRKEQQRLLETKEREAMHLLKEQGQMEQKIKGLVERFESISQTGNFA